MRRSLLSIELSLLIQDLQRNGRFIDQIGTYDPNYDPCKLNIDAEAAKKWLSNGAQPTEVVAKLFKMAGIEK